MKKTFEIKNDDLYVTIEDSNKVFIPTGEGQENIGEYTQTTVQHIVKDKVKVLKDFIDNEEKNAVKQLEQFEKQLEPLKDLQDIDENIIKHCKQAINKGTKPFKDSMKVLNQRLMDLDRKKTLMAQIEYINKQLEQVRADQKQLNKVLN